MFKPLKNRALIKPEEQKQVTSYGILLPDKDEKPVTGFVIVGNKDVKKGQKVLFSKFGYSEVTIEKQLYYVVSDFNILGIFND